MDYLMLMCAMPSASTFAPAFMFIVIIYGISLDLDLG